MRHALPKLNGALQLGLQAATLLLLFLAFPSRVSAQASQETWRDMLAGNVLTRRGVTLSPPPVTTSCTVALPTDSIRLLGGRRLAGGSSWTFPTDPAVRGPADTVGRWELQPAPRSVDSVAVRLHAFDCSPFGLLSIVVQLDEHYVRLPASAIDDARMDTTRESAALLLLSQRGTWEHLAYTMGPCAPRCTILLGPASRLRDSLRLIARAAAQDSVRRERAAIAARRQALLARGWPPAIVTSVMAGRVVLGMSSAQVLETLGEPERRNRTVTAKGTSEQWVYDGLYVYLTNGRVTAWQDGG